MYSVDFVLHPRVDEQKSNQCIGDSTKQGSEDKTFVLG